MTARRFLSLWLPDSLTLKMASGIGDDGRKALLQLALWCQQYSPLTAIDPPDGILIDITGCAHLFGGEAGLTQQLQTRLSGARVAIANTAMAAWGLARHGELGSENLEPLPLAALNLAPRTIIRLRRVGIRRIGELRRLPRAELMAGYGPEPALKLAQALGQAPEVLCFINAPPDWREIERHAEPIFTPLQLQTALMRLAARLCARLAQAQRGATALVARFYRIDSQCPEFCLGFAAPSHDELHIGRLLIEKLKAVDPGFGVEAISLEAAVTEPCLPVQRSTEQSAPDYSRVIDTVLNRLGPKNLWRVRPHEFHIPEHAARRMPVTLPPVPWAKPRHPRPVNLLPKPAPITAIAPVPDDPPVMFSWHGQTHRIRHATGPERIARDWWSHSHDNARPELDHVRDYYAVEDTEGARFWVFRAGTHAGFSPPRWYLHGFFG